MVQDIRETVTGTRHQSGTAGAEQIQITEQIMAALLTQYGYPEQAIRLMTEQTEKEMDALVDKGDAAFVAEMANATMKGQSWMSKPAANVLEVLQAYLTQNQLSFADTIKKLEKWKDEFRKEKDIKIRNIY
ncbi:hypothetical protein FQR65_LT15928 [Abscondita terminalis]|nr:hypothetical protein FQR65_LT15928 [Abscondita terminalis]